MPLRNFTNLIDYDSTTKFIITLAPILLDNFTTFNNTVNSTSVKITQNTTISKTNLRMTSQLDLNNNNNNNYLFGGAFGIVGLFLILILYIRELEKKNKELRDRLPIHLNNFYKV